MLSQEEFGLFFLTVVTLSTTSGQHTEANVSVSETVYFSSPGYSDGLNYGNNMTRDYRFTATYEGHTLLLTVIYFELEPAKKGCPYDNLKIYDGYNDSAPLLHTLCGNITASTTYQSTNNTVYIIFESDEADSFRGFEMTVVSDGATTTAVATTTTSGPRTGASQQGGNNSSQIKWIIVGCCVGGLVLLASVAVVLFIFAKKKQTPVHVAPKVFYTSATERAKEKEPFEE